MSEPLDREERDKLAVVLAVLTLDQLLQLAAMTTEVCQAFGFGRVYIELKNGHPHRIGVGDMAVQFPTDLTPTQVQEILQRYEKGERK